ncbi:MAG: outer membrane lipoprotein carrier protein LolA [Flavobacteriaceae bacterium]|nr:outer membrane lipoprotein carrier protein LolA [Flavobacteriaceae bacterium]
MNSKPFFLLFLYASLNLLYGQTSLEAKKLLEGASKQMESYSNITFDFSYVLNNRTEQINQESSGQVMVSQEKYRLNFLDAIHLFDGSKLYTIVPENEEITVTQVDEEEDFGINPKALLQFYKEGYDYQWDINQKIKGKTIQFVKLIPTEEEVDLKSLLVGIDIKKNHIYKLIEVGKNGTITTLTIDKIEVNTPIPEQFFVFNEEDYPDYYINN